VRDPTASRIRWRRSDWLAASGLIATSLVVTSNAWLDALRLALKDEEVQYVLVAPFFVAWLVWVRRARLRYCRSGGRWVGPLVMAAGWALWSYGYRRSVPTFWHGGPLVVAVGALLSVTGVDLVRKLLPAFAALPLLVPITPTRRQIIAAPLQAYAAGWTQSVCELFGLHVTRSGNLLSVNGANVEVAEACNGMRQLVTFWLVCYVLAFTRPLKWQARVLVLAAVPFVAIGSNVARLVPTVWVYSYGAGERAQRFHDWAGWGMLVIAFGFVWGMLAALRWATIPVERFQWVARAAAD
jgi:exosortase